MTTTYVAAYGAEKNVKLVTDESGLLTDVQVLLSEAQYRNFLKTHEDRDRHWKTSCATYAVQQELAKFSRVHHEAQLRKERDLDGKELSSAQHQAQREQQGEDKHIQKVMNLLLNSSGCFVALERMINNPPAADPSTSMFILLNQLDWLKHNLGHVINNDPRFKGWSESIDEFKDAIIKLLNNGEALTSRRLRKLFSVQNESGRSDCLGVFIAKLYAQLLGQGIKALYAILGNRVKQMVVMDAAIQRLSDAKSALEIRASLYGARYSQHSITPPEMITRLHQTEAKDAAPQSPARSLSPGAQGEKKWFSITLYADIQDIEATEQAIAIALHGPKTGKISGVYQFGVVLGGLVELLPVTARLVLSTVIGGLDIGVGILVTASSLIYQLKTCCSVDGDVTEVFDSYWEAVKRAPKRVHEGFVAADQALGRAHHYLSPLRLARYLAKKSYKGPNEDTPLVAALKETRVSNLFVTEMTDRVRATWVTGWMVESFLKLGSALLSAPRDVYVMFTAHFYMDAVEKQKKAFAQMTTQLKEVGGAISAQQDTISQSAYVSLADEKKEAHWPELKRPKAKEFTSIIDFIDDIIFGLTDMVIHPMFRLSPLLASLFFTLSMVSLGILFFTNAVPASWIGTFALTAEFFSEKFTGKSAYEGMFAKVVAVFLQWKVAFFSSELLTNLVMEYGFKQYEGRFDFLKELFRNIEQIVLGSIVLIGTGIGLGFIPELEVPLIGGLINWLAKESAECWEHAFLLAATIEFAFLGLKSLLLVVSLLSGTHTPEIKPLNAEQVTNFLHQKNLLNKQTPEDALTAGMIAALHQQGIEAQGEADPAFNKFVAKHVASIRSNLTNQRVVDAEVKADSLLQPKNEILRRTKAELQEAIDLASDYELAGKKFDSVSEANSAYDNLYFRFAAYNRALRALGHHDKQVDSTELLQSFYNRHCYQGSMVIMRLLTWPLALVWRPIKGLYAGTDPSAGYNPLERLLIVLSCGYLDRGELVVPSMREQVDKSWAKDQAMLLQTVALSARIAHAFVHAASLGIIRPIALTAVASFAWIGFLARCDWPTEKSYFKTIDEWVSDSPWFAWQRADFAFMATLSTWYAAATRAAGTTDHWREQLPHVQQKLDAVDPAMIQEDELLSATTPPGDDEGLYTTGQLDALEKTPQGAKLLTCLAAAIHQDMGPEDALDLPRAEAGAVGRTGPAMAGAEPVVAAVNALPKADRRPAQIMYLWGELRKVAGGQGNVLPVIEDAQQVSRRFGLAAAGV